MGSKTAAMRTKRDKCFCSSIVLTFHSVARCRQARVEMTKAVDKGLKCSYRGLLEALGTRAQGSYTGIDLAATFILRSALS